MGNNNSAPPKPKEVQDETLSEYFEYLYTEKLCFRRPQEEIVDINEAVIETINEILDEVGVLDKRFEKLKILFAGSMREGTRNGEPDEFDFLVVLKSLSTSDDIILRHVCKDKKGYAHIEIIQNASNELLTEWKDVIVDKKLKSTNSRRFLSSFRRLLGRAVRHVNKRKKHTITKPTGELKISSTSVKKHGPASLIMFSWKSREKRLVSTQTLSISVDVTPAIQFSDVETMIERGEINNDTLRQHLVASGFYMVIPCANMSCGFCFKLTFTNTEITLMLTMSKHHRKCYRILKYLFNGLVPTDSGAYTVTHSYALKTFVLNHDQENACDELKCGCLAQCVLKIINDIYKWLTPKDRFTLRMTLSSFLFPSHNIIVRLPTKTNLIRTIIGLSCMRASLAHIAKTDFSHNAEERSMQFNKAPLSLIQPYLYHHSPYHNLHSRKNTRLIFDASIKNSAKFVDVKSIYQKKILDSSGVEVLYRRSAKQTSINGLQC